jgi:hypothetical protein
MRRLREFAVLCDEAATCCVNLVSVNEGVFDMKTTGRVLAIVIAPGVYINRANLDDYVIARFLDRVGSEPFLRRVVTLPRSA